jgi:two-component system sensor histidine kinase BaeS
VFDRFWRADQSRPRDTGGSGLSLATCYQLVDTLGGSVTIESTVGVGATFTVRLSAWD